MRWSLEPDDPLLATPAIWHPQAPRTEWAVVWFERDVELPAALEPGTLRITASQRFELFLDGVRFARGPSRSDPDRWGVVTVALPALESGRHTLAVRVWHAGEHSGVAQMGPPAFVLVRPAREALAQWTTGEGWRCRVDPQRTPIAKHAWGDGGGPYDVAGAGESIDLMTTMGEWCEARIVAWEVENAWGNLPLECRLRPDPLPAMREAPSPWHRVAQADDALRPAAAAWLNGGPPLHVRANSDTRLVLDQGAIVNAYLSLRLRGGAGARIDLVTAEAPSLETWRDKPPRDQTQDVHYRGHRDAILPDGGEHTIGFCWFRSFRYLALHINTADQPLELQGIDAITTRFPLPEPQHTTIAGDGLPDVARIQAACDRTIALCAHELLFDCPHYEQCQFPGDARLQALYHYAIHDEPRLALKAIDDFHASRMPDGMIECRWPSTRRQVLPTFALQWIGMLGDALAWTDASHLTRYLPAAHGVVGWFLDRRRGDGLLGRIPNAPFVGWSPGFEKGNAPQDADGGSAIVTLMLARACDVLHGLEQRHRPSIVNDCWAALSDELVAAVRDRCMDEQRGLIADTPAKKSYSLHAQCEAVLAQLVPTDQAGPLLDRAMADDTLTRPGSFYYWHYVFEAARVARRPGVILDALPMWEHSLDRHRMDTLPEAAGATPRSDCHGWSAMPAYHLAATLLGLRPTLSAPGQRVVRFDPQPDRLYALHGSIPARGGRIKVAMRRQGDAWHASVESPVPVQLGCRGPLLDAGAHHIQWPVAAVSIDDGAATALPR